MTEDLFILILDLFGTAIFAITGALRGFRSRLDFFGVIVLGCAVGVGGGMMRDALIGATPAAALSDARYLIVCVLTSAVTFWSAPRISDKWNFIPICDALGLGVFTAIGVEKALLYDLPSMAVVLCGVLTAVGGGVIRDVMVMRIPAVLRSDFYATASLFGGILFVGILHFIPEFELFVRFLIVATFVTLLRIIAMRFKFHLPEATMHVKHHNWSKILPRISKE